MTKKILFISFFLNSFLFSEFITFRELTLLVSKDLQKSIYLDRDVPKYTIEYNTFDYQKKGELFEVYKLILQKNKLFIQFNKIGDFYFVKRSDKKYLSLPPLPVHPELEKHYFTYKVKNVTNKDIISSLSIFKNISFQYLKQSDIIAYSCTNREHNQIVKILNNVDVPSIQKKIKLSLFSVDNTKLRDVSSIDGLNFSFGSLVTDTLLSSKTTHIKLNNSFEFNAYLSFLNSWGATKIEQSPTLLLTNGVKTSLHSVTNIRYVTGSASVENANTSTTENFQFKDVGLKVEILPKIHKNFIFLELELTSEELLSLQDDNPVTSKIFYKNSFKVLKGKPLLLTGVNKKISKKLDNSFPYLSKIPYIGNIFKSKSSNNQFSNINLLIEVL